MVAKESAVNVYTTQPLNAGIDPHALRENLITPTELFFKRNHGIMPIIDPLDYRLVVDGMVNRPLMLSLDNLRRDFSQRTLVATVSCAGNRRRELEQVAPITGEVLWDAGAISTAVWRGVPIYEVLRAAGIGAEARHAAFLGLDAVEKNGETFGFGGSIPLEKALRGDVLLAYEMNGEPLPQDHGFPLRVVVPGYIGARSVKWLSTITLQRESSRNYYQAHAYKMFPPDVSAASANWEKGVELGELSLNSVICSPYNGDILESGMVEVEGFAVSGAVPVERVEVSADNGYSWQQAQFEGEHQRWAWRFWRARLVLPRGEHQLAVRATDAEGYTQPAEFASVWNFKGYMNNAWHRICVQAV